MFSFETTLNLFSLISYIDIFGPTPIILNYYIYNKKDLIIPINEKPDLETEGEGDNYNQKLKANADQNDKKGCC